MKENIGNSKEQYLERETEDKVSGDPSAQCSRAISVEQIDDSELPQSIKDCLKGDAEGW